MRKWESLAGIFFLMVGCVEPPPQQNTNQQSANQTTCVDCARDMAGDTSMRDVGGQSDLGSNPSDTSVHDDVLTIDTGGGADATADSGGNDDAGIDAGNSPGLTHRIPLTVPATVVDDTLQDFPVLVQTQSDDLRNLGISPGQIRFLANDFATALPFEIERYVPNEGRLTAWVKLSELSNAADTSFYLAVASDADPAAAEPAAVWKGYAAVWHMSDDDLSDNQPVRDSSENANDGRANNTAQDNRVAIGHIGGAMRFDGIDDFVEIADDSTFRPAGGIFISAWIRPNMLGFDSANVVSKPARSVTQDNNDSWQIYLNSSMQLRSVSSHAGNPRGFGSSTIAPDRWTHVALVFDGSSVSHYVDGNRPLQAAVSGDIDYDSDPVLIGAEYDAAQTIAYFDGQIDEIRVYPAPRGSGWISTEHRNQREPDAFVIWGALETLP